MKKYLNQQDMKDINIGSVLRLIRRAGPMTRRQIEAAADMSWGAISNATALLLREGYIKEVKIPAPAGAGRTPIALEVDRETHCLLGLDVNRSDLSGVVTDLTGEVLHRVELEPTATKREEWIDEISALIRRLLSLAAGRRVLAVGVAMQGAVDSKHGIAASFPAESWQDVPLAQILSERFSLPVYLEHDPDCILYAASAQRDLRDAILLRADKGIGMAVMLNGRIFKRFGAFEIGEMPVNGRRLADVATLTGAAQNAGMPFAELKKAAERGEKAALSHFEEIGRALGVAMDGVAQLFNIREFLLCGKLTAHRDLFANAMQGALTAFPTHEPLRVDYTEVGLAAVGAALLAVERHELHFE